MPWPVDECYRLHWTNSVPLKCKRCTNTIPEVYCILGGYFVARACERGYRGYIVPGPTSYPGLGGLGRVQVFALSFGSLLHPGAYLGLHPTLGKKSNQISVKTFFLLFNKFWAKTRKKTLRKFGAGSLIYGLGGPIRFGGPVSTFVPLRKFSLWGPVCG